MLTTEVRRLEGGDLAHGASLRVRHTRRPCKVHSTSVYSAFVRTTTTASNSEAKTVRDPLFLLDGCVCSSLCSDLVLGPD
ncbi:hypothetical protein M514_09073 [Trichuris suis]|nr:hypothetical protein M514_09073 [Trichuris suis]